MNEVSDGDVVVAVPGVGAADTGQPPEEASVGIPELVKDYRVVLVLDRCGSMIESNKVDGAREALAVWRSNYCNPGTGQLRVVVYDHEVVRAYELHTVTEIDLVADVENLQAAIEPRGLTNIHDALEEVADMLIDATSAQGRAVYQDVLLVSDGVHNTPPPAKTAFR